MSNRLRCLNVTSLLIAYTLAAVASNSKASDLSELDQDRLDKLEQQNNKLWQENEKLRLRLEALEVLNSEEISVPSAEIPSKTLDFLGRTELSGSISASYFYDGSKPTDRTSNGLTFTQNHNSFTLNHVKLTLDHPVNVSPDEWDAGYNVMLMFGQDSPFVNTFGNGSNGDIRQAYVGINVPVGNGLVIKAGQLISLLNFESGDGGIVNPTWSQGNQWFFTGNGPSTGVQGTYTLSEKVSTTVRIQNNMYGAQDNNSSKTLMGNISMNPDGNTWVTLIGFGGPEGFPGDTGDGNWLKGVQLLAGRKLSEENNVNAATELTYMHWDGASVSLPGDDAEAWSAGIWLWADFTEKWGLAGRADFVSDVDGAFTSGLLGFPTHGGQDLASLTLTLNLRPTPNTVVKPEVRYDRTSLTSGFDGADNRVSVGAGVGYLF